MLPLPLHHYLRSSISLKITGELTKLVDDEGDSMFTCYNGDASAGELEAVDESYIDSDELYTDVAAKQPTSLYGNHDCVFDKMPNGFKDSNVKMVITEEANANFQNSITGEFKAELLGYSKNSRALDEDVHISCFRTAEPSVFSFFCTNSSFGQNMNLLIIFACILPKYRKIHLQVTKYIKETDFIGTAL